jgi:3-deoxy-D-manno-octulosonic-acid transferase
MSAVVDALATGAYRSAMRAAAGAAGLATRLPGAPPNWRSLGDRLGRLAPAERTTASGGRAIWLHAASVGELVAVRPLLARLRERFSGRLYVVSTLTRTGLALARGLPEAHLALLFPLDAPSTVRRLLGNFELDAFLFTETEIWPVFLTELAAAGVPAFMVSGRVSERTMARATWLKPVYRRALREVTCCMQSEADAARITALGADPRHVVVAGNVKFDAPPAAAPPEIMRLAARLETGGQRLVVAGSTHAGEDEIVLAAYRRLVPEHPDLLLLLAPRHPERYEAVAAAVGAAGFALTRYSELIAGHDGASSLTAPRVVLLDVVGSLAHLYALGVAAFVGGSLVPAGGHNVLEPARAARPVLVGPHTEHAEGVVERLLAAGGAERVESADALTRVLDGLLRDHARALDMGRRAQALVRQGEGAVERHLKVIATRLTSARFARAPGEP